jgi:hypothetical protein
MDMDFLFGSAQFETELHVKHYFRKWRPLTSSTLDETQNTSVPTGIHPCVKHNCCLPSNLKKTVNPIRILAHFRSVHSHFVLVLVTDFFFEKAED